jgi:hypothetical protein
MKLEVEDPTLKPSLIADTDVIDVYLTLIDAVKRGINETSKLPLKRDETQQTIGAECKVLYNDDTWYTGRVLFYDPKKHLHFVYFDVDGTAEWVDFREDSDDAALLVDELVVHANWPGRKYLSTTKAIKFIRATSVGSTNGVKCFEYVPYTYTILCRLLH